MRRKLYRVLALSLVTVLILSVPVLSTADGVSNVIKGSKGIQPYQVVENRGGPSYDDIRATRYGDIITAPAVSEYLPSYEYKYITAPKGLCVYVYFSPTSAKNVKNTLPMGYCGTKAKLLAVNDETDMACILYRTAENEIRAGWIQMEYLTDSYPGICYQYGNFSSLYSYIEYEEADLRWSKTYFVDSGTKYSEFTETQRNVLALTIDYQVISRNGVSDPSGARDVYFNDGSGWEKVGYFDVEKELSPVHYTINFDFPTTVGAVAVVPQNRGIEGFLFRLSVVDVDVSA